MQEASFLWKYQNCDLHHFITGLAEYIHLQNWTVWSLRVFFLLQTIVIPLTYDNQP